MIKIIARTSDNSGGWVQRSAWCNPDLVCTVVIYPDYRGRDSSPGWYARINFVNGFVETVCHPSEDACLRAVAELTA